MVLEVLKKCLANSQLMGRAPLTLPEVSYYIVRKPYSPKTVCKAYARRDHSLLFIIKAVLSEHRVLLENEIQTLRMLSTLADKMFETPVPLHEMEYENSYFTVESPLEGYPLNHLIESIVRKDRAAAENLIFRLFEHMAQLHQILQRQSGQPLQHGDLHLGNIFYSKSKRFQVVDWSFCSAELPPLFDLFSTMSTIFLFTGYQGSRVLPVKALQLAFFDDNWLAHLLAAGMGSYCRDVQIDLDRIGEYFRYFLQIRLHRFETLGYPKRYGDRFVELRQYYDDHRDEFLKPLLRPNP